MDRGTNEKKENYALWKYSKIYMHLLGTYAFNLCFLYAPIFVPTSYLFVKSLKYCIYRGPFFCPSLCLLVWTFTFTEKSDYDKIDFTYAFYD